MFPLGRVPSPRDFLLLINHSSICVSAVNAGDGIQLVISGVITGAGKQAVTMPVLLVSYWVVGLPLGAVAAFSGVPTWGLAPDGLLGLWLGMTLAVWLHVSAYLLICFGHPCVPWAIDWPRAAELATARLAQPVADVVEACPPIEETPDTDASINALTLRPLQADGAVRPQDDQDCLVAAGT